MDMLKTGWNFFQNEVLGMAWLNRLIGNLINACGLDATSKIGGSIQFFVYDTIKIMVLLGVLILIISYIQSYFPPERTKKILGRFHGTEDEIVPVSNSPPDFKRSIQGHKRCLTDEDRKRLRQSIDNRHHKTTVANGSIMMCEVQGAKEDFIRRWNLVFKDYPDVFEDNDCRSAILFLIDDTSAYLQTIKERVL